jgi:hypothetical protein
MAELVRQPTVALQQRYGVKVFSLRNWDALLTWLDDLEAGMTEGHRSAGAAVTPSGPVESAPPADSSHPLIADSSAVH